jgi:hypothetical protein
MEVNNSFMISAQKFLRNLLGCSSRKSLVRQLSMTVFDLSSPRGVSVILPSKTEMWFGHLDLGY